MRQRETPDLDCPDRIQKGPGSEAGFPRFFHLNAAAGGRMPA
jgi:hypothetical protein